MDMSRNGLPSDDWHPAEHVALPESPTDGRVPAEWAARAAMGLLYAPMPWILRLIVAVHFRRLRVRHSGRFPPRGAALLVANHPATWMDAAVLATALGRRLHFLTNERLFQPRPRGWILSLFGSLPVAQHDDPPGRALRNARTFARCQTLLARGEVVGVFPEGVSAGDRSVGPLHTGAARIALERVATGRPLEVIPVGIHYADRTAFRTDVVVSVGRPLRLASPASAGSHEAWTEQLTARLRTAIATLIVDVPDPSLRWLVEELTPSVRSAEPGAFESLRRLASGVGRLRQRSPRDLADCERHARRHLRLRRRLRLGTDDLAARSEFARAAFVAIAALPAAAGVLLNAPPAAIAARGAGRYPDPVHVGLARIVGGIVCFAGWYAVTTLAVGWLTGSAWLGLAATSAAAAVGMVALIWNDAWSRVRGRTRIAVLRRRHPRLLARLQREQAVLRSFRDRLARPARRRSVGAARGLLS